MNRQNIEMELDNLCNLLTLKCEFFKQLFDLMDVAAHITNLLIYA